ncbi:MAG: hypothetical protein H6539_02280 [Bacteroidales bacterium]|nr:hypothetical protein [Bacteroidales bacterium]
MNIWYLLIPIIILSGCNSNSIPSGEVSAKIIEYKVTYLNEQAGSIPTKMLPRKMIVIFAGNFAMNRIEGFFGQFSLIYIGNLKNESVITLLRIFDKKYVYYGKKGELPCGFKETTNLSITETDAKKDILGYSSNEWLISSDSIPEFKAWSTSEIKIKNPNVTTPYKDLGEVLLEFNTQLSLLDMNLTASSIEEKMISWESFKVSDDYQERSKEFMERKFRELFK